MKLIELFTSTDNKSYFLEHEIDLAISHALGHYSKKYPVEHLMFREFEAGLVFDWHTAPQKQFILYLTGSVEIEASGGEKRVFSTGDALLVSDTVGAGHITKTVSAGQSIIITYAQKTGADA
jgi:hypothetical protein